jgi:hypothetical protein
MIILCCFIRLLGGFVEFLDGFVEFLDGFAELFGGIIGENFGAAPFLVLSMHF